MDNDNTTVTESWKDKNYEMKLTEYYFDVVRELRHSTQMPTLDSLKIVFSNVKSFGYAALYSRFYLKKFQQDVKPLLNDIEKVLYGDPKDPRILMLRHKYEIKIITTKHGKTIVLNSQNLLKELWEVFFLLKQWAYEQGFFAKQPAERKYGRAAIESVFEM